MKKLLIIFLSVGAIFTLIYIALVISFFNVLSTI